MITDFGISRLVGDYPSGLTTVRMLTGTIRYTSPEIMNEGTSITLKGDIWSWACVLYEARHTVLPSFFSTLTHRLGPTLLSRTGEQFYAVDKWSATGRPLLEVMADKSAFSWLP